MQLPTVLTGLKRAVLALAGVALAGLATAQQSSSFQMTEYTFNAGGHPAQGTILTSGSFQLTLDALGDAISGTATNSSSFSIGNGFPASFGPPLEAQNLRFTDAVTLAWDPDGSVGEYELYRGQVVAPFDPNYGSCLSAGITDLTATDFSAPGPGLAFFYLVTARNRLDEEGSKGLDPDNLERDNSFPCP